MYTSSQACEHKRKIRLVPRRLNFAVQLRIEGEGLRHTELSLHDLQTKFKRHSVVAAMQCSGNRRHGMNEVKKIQGLDWDIGEFQLMQLTSDRVWL